MIDFDWREVLVLAKNLNSNSVPTCINDARWRAAIGRAYYAAFCSARDFLRSRGEIPTDKSKSTHHLVISRFRGYNDPKWASIGDKLSDMKDERTTADYEVRADGLEEKAILTITISNEVIGLLASMTSDVTPAFVEPTPPRRGRRHR